MLKRSTPHCDREAVPSDKELRCELEAKERRLEHWIAAARRHHSDLSDNALLTTVEIEQPKLAREIEILRIIRDISAKQNATEPVNRPRDISRHPSGNALIEPRYNWRIGRRFSR